MRTVQAAWFYRHRDSAGADPDFVADNPLEILEWLGRIRS
jgi:hypothetical protein